MTPRLRILATLSDAELLLYAACSTGPMNLPAIQAARLARETRRRIGTAGS